jgi:hypothetical protein
MAGSILLWMAQRRAEGVSPTAEQKGAGPTYLAALAQVSESRSGCDGLVLLTNGGGGASGPLHLLTLDRHFAMRWLDPSADWQEAFPLVSEGSDMNDHFETVPVRQRFNLRR